MSSETDLFIHEKHITGETGCPTTLDPQVSVSTQGGLDTSVKGKY